MLLTFFLAVVGWIIFRAESIEMAWKYVCGICDASLFTVFIKKKIALSNSIFIVIMLAVEWLQKDKTHGLEISRIKNGWLRFAIYYAIILLILGSWGQEQTFIYFQF